MLRASVLNILGVTELFEKLMQLEACFRKIQICVQLFITS